MMNYLSDMENVVQEVSSPAERMRANFEKEVERRTRFAEKAVKNKFRLNWEKRIKREVDGVTFCAHVYERTGTNHRVSLKVHVKINGKLYKVSYPLCSEDELDSLKNEDYRRILEDLGHEGTES